MNIDLFDPIYAQSRSWIENRLKTQRETLDQLLAFAMNGDKFSGLKSAWHLDEDADFTQDVWREMVKAVYDEIQQITNVVNDHSNNSEIIEGDRWEAYAKYLKDQKWPTLSIDQLRLTTKNILANTNIKTPKIPNNDPTKGLVIGQVQSGKTASIAGLLAMGADNGFNFFIILSGTIENLRNQTKDRLKNDINNDHLANRYSFLYVDPSNEKLSKLKLDHTNKAYFTVFLKNTTRLSDLKKWLEKEKGKKLNSCKILIIDDEADQASLNTKSKIQKNKNKEKTTDRSTINQRIVDILQLKTEKMNYIGYTATPYACFLNEAFKESLYPKDFIFVLPKSKEYFGPVEIFGLENEQQELDIVRQISKPEISQLKLNQRPKALEDAICWFLCASACRRFFKQTQSTSMLIHTSQKVNEHQDTYELIQSFFQQQKDILIQKCQSIWEKETTRFTKDHFKITYQSYPYEILDYPTFDEIKPYLEELLSKQTHIPLNDDNDFEYHKGVHICIDNYASSSTQENEYVRLVYPSKDQDLAYNPAFIVIGGNTLSRGLTIEGLVSTFFLRNSIQVDSLMQMGRWFGYRKGYELLPRIWLSTETLEKFKFLSALEKELQDDLFDFTLKSKKPKDFAPKVIIPKSSCLLLLTQRNKMKHAKRISLDYSDSHQQHTLFDLDQTQHNLETTQSFLTDIGGITKSRISHINTSRIWEDIDYSHIKAYLSKMRFHENSSFFNQTELLAFFEWFEKYQSDFEKWHIVLGSIQSEQNGSWPDFGVNIVHRTAKINGNKCEIKIIKDALDVICDVPQKISLPKDYKSNQAVKLIRYQNQLSNTPQLLIYRINAKDQNDQTKACKDLIAVSLLVPSIDLTDSNLKEYYQLDLNDFMEEIDNDTDE